MPKSIVKKEFHVVSNRVDGSTCMSNNLNGYVQASQDALSRLEKGHSSVKIIICMEKESVNNDPNKLSSS
jgi:hypothetical protein